MQENCFVDMKGAILGILLLAFLLLQMLSWLVLNKDIHAVDIP